MKPKDPTTDPLPEMIHAANTEDEAPPPELLDRILAEIPEPFPSTVHRESAEQRPERDSPNGKVVWGRFVRSPQALAAAAGLLLLVGAGWIALRLGGRDALPNRQPGAGLVSTAQEAPASNADNSEAMAGMELRAGEEIPENEEVLLQDAAAKAEKASGLQKRVPERSAPTNEGSSQAVLGGTGGAANVAEQESSARIVQPPAFVSPPRAENAVAEQSAGAGRRRDADRSSGELRRSLSDAPARPPASPAPAAPSEVAEEITVTSEAPVIEPRSLSQGRISRQTARRESAAPSPPPPEPTVATVATEHDGANAPVGSSAAGDERKRKQSDRLAAEPAMKSEVDQRLAELPAAQDRLTDQTADLSAAEPGFAEADDETRFAPRQAKPLTDPRIDAASTFGLDVDTASYAMVRSALRQGRLPRPERVRPEEFLNAFDYGDRPPERSDFALHAEVGDAEFSPAPQRRLVRFAMRARDVSATQRLPASLTFVVDTSGSMRQEGRLEMVQDALSVLLDALRPEDQVALVRYSDRAELLVELTTDHQALRAAIAALRPSGSTNLQAGLQVGYQAADRGFREGALHRVILLSDGIANVGDTEALPILRSVADWAARGVELTTVGVGMSHNDPLLEQLANRGDGNYAYVDTLEEARRIFREQLTGTLETIASDARVQVRFDPETIAGYRLIGYENRALPDHLFRNDSVDAGEVGAGHRVTALYEVELRTADGLRSRRATQPAITLELRYRSRRSGRFEEQTLAVPLGELSQHEDEPQSGPRGANSAAFRLAASLAVFAEELQLPRPSPATLSAAAREVRAVLPHFEHEPKVLELAYLMNEAARIAETGGAERR